MAPVYSSAPKEDAAMGDTASGDTDQNNTIVFKKKENSAGIINSNGTLTLIRNILSLINSPYITVNYNTAELRITQTTIFYTTEIRKV